MQKKQFKKIYIEITNNCNLNCSFCSKSKKKKKNITIKEFDYILNQIKDYTNYIYLHVKGEPLIHKDIIKFLKLTEKYNLNVNLTTNGTLLSDVVDELKQCNSLKKINFSLHSENNIDDYFENIFKSVGKLSENIIKVYRIWTLENGKLDNKSTNIVNKITKYYNLSPEIVEKIKNNKNTKILSTIYVDKDNEFEWPSLDAKEKTNGFCQALKTHIAILVDGTVVPCCLDSEGCINLGNIYNETLENIINSERYQKMKKSFQDRKPIENLCQNCTYKNRFKM